MLKIGVDSFSEVWYTNGRRKNSTRVNRLVTWRYEFTIIAARFLDENSAWPHLWPSTASDYVETVLTRASESTVFGLKSTIKSTKVVKKRWRICSGRRSRKFESCHLDHKEKTALVAVFSLCLCVALSSLVVAWNNASSHSPLEDRQARLSGEERVNHGAKRSHLVTSTK